MPCYHPLPAFYGWRKNPSGKRPIVFARRDGIPYRPVELPCGTCIGCKLERSRQWAMRCVHEARLHRDNCFVTLTYDDEHLPPKGSLRPEDFVNFMKRLRKHFGEGIRFFHCGEYGELLGRPHHHALLFNHAFPDQRFHKKTNDVPLYTSERLDALWGHGQCTLGDASFESAAYIARYTLKKVVGKEADAHYQGKVPEYLTMSRRPGLGRGHLDELKTEIYRHDEVIIRGQACKPPRYYDNVFEKQSPTVLAKVKARRRRAAAASVDNTGKRLIIREAVKTAAVKSLVRNQEPL